MELMEMSSRVGTNYNVKERWKKCRHEVLEETRESRTSFTRGKFGLRSRKFVFRNRRKIKHSGTDAN